MSDLLQMSVAQVEKMASLNADLFYEVLKRLDGPTLASAAFCSISKEERLWEIRQGLILSIGGFRKFYADCFPLGWFGIAYRRNDYLEYPEEWTESEYYGDMDEFESISPSDFDGFNGCFYNCDLLTHADTDYDNDGEVFLSAANGLPPITSMETEKRDGKLWRGLRDGLRLSWIVANGKIKQAANLACCYPLGGQRHWPTDKDFVMLFGSILPAIDILPCQVVECILSLKLRVICTEGEGVQTTLKLTELSMQFEDMEGNCFNGRNILSLVLIVQNELKEEKMRNESRLDRLCILSGIAALVSLCYYVL
ncbi:unnamed protein product [Malus baccata var. baccata]